MDWMGAVARRNRLVTGIRKCNVQAHRAELDYLAEVESAWKDLDCFSYYTQFIGADVSQDDWTVSGCGAVRF